MYNLQQQVKALTIELQELLDAQSTGLLMEHPYHGPIIKRELEVMEASKKASKTGRSGWDGGVTSSVMLGTSRVGPKINLKAARQGIVRAMKALAEVKSMEEEVYALEEAERLKNIGQVEEWENKRKELEEGVKEVEEGGEARRVIELRREREDVEVYFMDKCGFLKGSSDVKSSSRFARQKHIWLRSSHGTLIYKRG